MGVRVGKTIAITGLCLGKHVMSRLYSEKPAITGFTNQCANDDGVTRCSSSLCKIYVTNVD